MRPEVVILGLSIIIAILIAVLFLVLKMTKNRYERMKEKFTIYLEELDKENERLHKGIIPDKPRRNYKKIMV